MRHLFRLQARRTYVPQPAGHQAVFTAAPAQLRSGAVRLPPGRGVLPRARHRAAETRQRRLRGAGPSQAVPARRSRCCRRRRRRHRRLLLLLLLLLLLPLHCLVFDFGLGVGGGFSFGRHRRRWRRHLSTGGRRRRRRRRAHLRARTRRLPLPARRLPQALPSRQPSLGAFLSSIDSA